MSRQVVTGLVTHRLLGLLLGVAVVAGGGGEAAAKTPQASDAQYTIQCQTYTGPQHAQLARQAKDALVKVTKMPDWYVVSGESESNLYYGFYRTYNDPKEADTKRAQKDRQALGGMTDTNGSRPFQYAVFVAIAGQDPEANPEWDLRNAKGYFSLQIATYMESPLRKQAAVDAVRDARAQGIEAYYYHGESASHVCIGSWARDAMREQESDSGRTDDPDQPVLVSNTPLPSYMKDLRTKETGQKVKVLAPRPEYLDPTLVAMKEKYPTHAINGETVLRKYKTREGQEVMKEEGSFLVLIPAKEEVVSQDPVLEQKAKELGVVPPQQGGAAKRHGGQLKSIGR